MNLIAMQQASGAAKENETTPGCSSKRIWFTTRATDSWRQWVPRRVRERRLAKGLTQERAGTHRTYVGGIELGLRNPSLRNIARIADALEITLCDFFCLKLKK